MTRSYSKTTSRLFAALPALALLWTSCLDGGAYQPDESAEGNDSGDLFDYYTEDEIEEIAPDEGEQGEIDAETGDGEDPEGDGSEGPDSDSPGDSEPGDPTAPDEGSGTLTIPIVNPEPLFCDDSLHAGEDWAEVEIGDLAYRFLPGTAAERDLDRIALDRQLVYDRIVEKLGIGTRPKITVVLSPNRMAASHHGYGAGRAVKHLSRVEVLWPEGEGSFERERPGHEIAHILGVHVDGKAARLAFLDEGLAEYLDGSDRDLHREYVDKLLAGVESGFPTRMEDWDAWGMNYGRAGSFVTFLIDRYGMDRFLDLWRAAATTGGWAQITTLGDSVQDGRSLEEALDRMLRQTHGVGFDAVRLVWEAALRPYLESAPTRVPEDDLIAMLALVAAADRAVAQSDALAYRATLEGFYCDQWTDDAKAEISREVVAAYDRIDTTVISVYPVGIRNYQEVVLHTVRREVRRGEEESLRTGMLWLERFPEGWRISWSSVW